ncbi:hypothetical protein [Citricoccus sp. K5]|uniref:hypothetical protein n=1 Tax=Citricoccus sp. K5 TaxID=2653135 RepID=UPI0012F0A210|nr:hypothetical protein [Citricoccus sp. K5]VXB24796.1 hypothetical protein CITRIK5_30040 [Citricoccus sp. K5]
MSSGRHLIPQHYRDALAIVGIALAITAAVVGWVCLALFGADVLGLPVWVGTIAACGVPIVVMTVAIAHPGKK